MINDVVKLLGLKHCQDTETLILKTIIDSQFKDYVIKNYNSICTAFGFAKNEVITEMIKKGKGYKNNNGKLETVIFYCLNNIMYNFCGCKLEINEKSNHSRLTIDYKLKGLSYIRYIVTHNSIGDPKTHQE